MKFEPLSKANQTLPKLKPFNPKVTPRDSLNPFEILHYGASLNLYAMRILRDEITVNDRGVIDAVMKESIRTLQVADKMQEGELFITRREVNRFYKTNKIKKSDLG